MPVVKYTLDGDSAKLEKALGSVRSEFANAEKVADKYNATLSETRAALQKVADAERATAATRKKAIAGVLALVAASAAAASATFGLVTEIADLRDELGDLSAETALGVDTLNSLRIAAGASGTQLSELAPSLRQLAKRMDDVRMGTGEAKQAFADLGIDVRDARGELRSADDVFKEAIGLLQGVENETQRAAMATRIFGESGVKLTQVLGDVPLDAFNERAAIFGTDVGPDAVAAAAEWQSGLQDLSGVLEVTKGWIADVFGPSGQVNIDAMTGAFALLRITVDEVTQVFHRSELAEDIHEIAVMAGHVQAAWSSALDQLVPDFAEFDGILGRIARRFDDLRDPQRIVADGASRIAKELADGEAVRLEFLRWSEDLDDELEKDAAAIKKVADESIGLKLSLTELGELSETMFAGTLKDDVIALSDSMKAEAAAQYAEDLREAIAVVREFADAEAAALQHTEDLREGFRDLTDSSIGAVGAWASALQLFVDEGSAAFKALFAIQKAAAIAGVIVDTSRAVMLTLATVPPPAGPLLAVATAATGAAQLAAIIGTSIGSGGGGGGARIEAGGVPGVSTSDGGGGSSIPWQRDEPDNPGGDRVLNVIQFRHELYDATVPDSARIPGSAMSRVQKDGRRTGRRPQRVTPRRLL